MNVRRPELFSKSDIRVVLFLTVAILIGGAVIIYEKSREVIYPEVVIRQLERSEALSDQAEIKAGRLSESMLSKYRINVNTAPFDSLVLLPGIGDHLAARIIESRTNEGRFDSVGELVRVNGIGPAKLRAVRNMIEVGEE
jgi:competence ComEA-like helix-hairpin-helix protein